MKKEFLPYQLALELKELGFNEECLALWQSKRKGEPYININSPKNIKALLSCSINNSDVEYIVSAPLWQQAFDWLREKYDIEINITRMPPEAIKSSFNKGNKRIKKYNMWVWSLNGNPRIENPSLFFDNYEEALEIGLQEALKLIK